MALRVYAMYAQSRKILIFLAVSFLAQSVAILALNVAYGASLSARFMTEYIYSGIHVCIGDETVSQIEDALALSIVYPEIFFDTLLLILALWCFARHSTESIQISGQWEVNRWIRILLQDSILYFVLDTAATLLNGGYAFYLTGTYAIMVSTFKQIEPSLLAPRLVISIREYHRQVVEDSELHVQMESMIFRACSIPNTQEAGASPSDVRCHLDKSETV
ncbi:hypothetical protein BV22DRAFT_1127354 [Leucogyrophana mollusca]|uniref:Uncharacterized protein n=1 Tax=Leucogyrophana mollusca TaxID=85980 RepID=A0ACB8BS50_9AGAM|nr:hypothetical protein BV22DRAFT_1127354 [Leucogyrophana mollusca]